MNSRPICREFAREVAGPELDAVAGGVRVTRTFVLTGGEAGGYDLDFTDVDIDC
jgi:hypothetical protein